MAKVKITETAFRDAHQSLNRSRMTTEYAPHSGADGSGGI